MDVRGELSAPNTVPSTSQSPSLPARKAWYAELCMTLARIENQWRRRFVMPARQPYALPDSEIQTSGALVVLASFFVAVPQAGSGARRWRSAEQGGPQSAGPAPLTRPDARFPGSRQVILEELEPAITLVWLTAARQCDGS